MHDHGRDGEGERKGGAISPISPFDVEPRSLKLKRTVSASLSLDPEWLRAGNREFKSSKQVKITSFLK